MPQSLPNEEKGQPAPELNSSVFRNRKAHVLFFGQTRDWAKDLGSFFQCSPWTTAKWGEGTRAPTSVQMSQLDRITACWEKKRPFKQWVENDAERLDEMRRSGIGLVEVLGCNNPGDDCAACLRLKNQKIFIATAPRLPLPACDLPFCKCILLASQ